MMWARFTAIWRALVSWFIETPRDANSRRLPPGQRFATPPPVESTAPAATEPRVPSKPRRRTSAKAEAPNLTDVVIGVDFGTSTSKILFRTPYLAGGRTFPVSFDPRARGIARYLVPTMVHEDGYGVLHLDAASDRTPHRDLKIRVLEAVAKGTNVADPFGPACGYLASILRHARKQVLRSGAVPPRSVPRWWFNLGIVSDGYEGNSTRSKYEALAGAAWALSLESELPTLRDARASFQDAGSATNLQSKLADDVTITVVPEFAAAVAAYARSKQRREGLHFMVDIGATTVDAASFILHAPDYENTYQILGSDIRHLGVYSLHRRRLKALGVAFDTRSSVSEGDPLAAVPADLGEYVTGAVPQRVHQAELQFERDFVEGIMTVVKEVRTRKYGNAPEWRTGLPFFMAGGGGQHAFYTRALQQVNQRITTSFSESARIVRRNIPVPKDLIAKEITEQEYRFLAVAYGLSRPPDEIGTIRPAKDLSDLPPNRARDWSQRFVDKEKV